MKKKTTKEKKDHVYSIRGEKRLEDVFKTAIGVGVNQAMRYMMDDVKNMDYGDVYDAHILVNNIALKELTCKLATIENRREDLIEELRLLDDSENELNDAIDKIERELVEYQNNKKTDRNLKLNQICNKVLIAYDKNRDSFDSVSILSIIDDSEVEESVNIVVSYIENSVKSLKIDDVVCLHESEFDEGYKIRLTEDDIERIIDLLEEVAY